MPQIFWYIEGFPTKTFGTVRQKTLTKPWCPPTLQETFRYHVLLRNTEGFPFEFFRHCQTKINQQKIVMLFPLLLHPIFFKYQKASETTKGSRMKFFSPVRQKVFEKSVILPPIQQNFLYQTFLKAERFPYQFSRCYETQKNFRQNCDVTTPRPRSSMHDNFRHQKFFEIQICSPTRLIVSVKKSSTVNGEILLWCIKIPIPEFFWNTERLNGYTTKFIGTMSHKKNRESPWCSPALLFEKIFDTSYFSNQRKTMIRFSTALRDKKLSTENRDTPILCMNFIRYPKIFETPKCSPMYFFTTVRQKFLTKPWYPPPPIHESFLYQFFLKYRCVPLLIFSAMWYYLFSMENWDNLTPPPLYP